LEFHSICIIFALRNKSYWKIEPGSSIPRIPRIFNGNDDEGYLLAPQQRREHGGIVFVEVTSRFQGDCFIILCKRLCFPNKIKIHTACDKCMKTNIKPIL